MPQKKKRQSAHKRKKTKKRSASRRKKIQHHGAKFKAPEFIYYNKGIGWYVIISIVTLGLLILFLWLQMWLLAAVVGVGGIVVMQFGKVKPKKHDAHIMKDKIEYKGKIYPINQFKSFWVVYDKPSSTVYLETTKMISPWISIHVSTKEIEHVHNSLANFLPEKKTISEDFFIKINRWLRF